MKKITHTDYLIAQGLYTLAVKYAKKAEEFRHELEQMLEVTPYGHVADAIYDGDERGLDEALRKEMIEVERN